MVKTAQHIINLRKTRGFVRHKKAKKAIYILKGYLIQHTKKKIIWISPKINEYIWKNGIKNIPSFLKVQIATKDDTAYVELASVDFKHPDFAVVAEEKKKKVKKKVVEKEEAQAKDAKEKSPIKDAKNEVKVEGKSNTKAEKPEKHIEVKAKTPQRETTKEVKKEESYDLPVDLVKILKDGSIEGAKESIKKLNKADLEKVLKFEQAHQNRKGILQFLESNMR